MATRNVRFDPWCWIRGDVAGTTVSYPRNMRAQTFDSARLECARAECHTLLQAAEPLLGLAHTSLACQPHLIALSDKKACVLRLWLDPSTQEAAAAGGNPFEGASWDERDTGRNGIGTCPRVGHPVILIGPEHFQEEYVGWTCIGVPIRGPDGTLAGISAIHVDDDTYSRELVQRVLTDAGAMVRTAASAGEALRLLDDEKCDVLLCDLSMPDVDGQTFVRQLKASGGWKAGLPSIALTALGREEDRERA